MEGTVRESQRGEFGFCEAAFGVFWWKGEESLTFFCSPISYYIHNTGTFTFFQSQMHLIYKFDLLKSDSFNGLFICNFTFTFF